MLELGKYAAPVVFAYGAALALLLGIIIISFTQYVSKSKYLKNLKKN